MKNKLIADAKRFLEENYSAKDVLLVSAENAATFKKVQEVKAIPIKPVKISPPIPVAAKVVKEIPHAKVETPKTAVDPMMEMRQLMARTAPHFRLRETPLDDESAKKAANAWKESAVTIEAAVITYGEKDASLVFLTNIVQAINVGLMPAELIDGQKMESEKAWESFLQTPSLKWIIAPCRMIGKSPELTRHYREMPATSERFLGNVPLLFLAPIADYFKNPGLKRDLWKQLCQIIVR